MPARMPKPWSTSAPASRRAAMWSASLGPSSRRHDCCDRLASASDSARKASPGFMQDILINWSPQETRVAVVESGALQELHIERTLERGLVGNIYTGRVARVLPGMQSAFIDI